MNFMKYNSLNQKQTSRQNLSQINSHQPVSCRDFHEMLDLLSNTDDIDLLVKIFSTLGICLLTKNIKYDQAIKCEALYKKLALVLRSSLQTKSIVALNLISTLLYPDNENGLTGKKALHVYAKNMIRFSGCLTAMSEIFTSLMMHQDIWKALCRSISETCNGNIPNQSHCSHLIPLCVQRCQRGNLDPVSVLLSLLSKHQDNVKLFHENNGISIFNGEFLRNAECLQLLNLVVESTRPEYREEILKASNLFRELRSYLNKYGLNSSIGQWVSVILFSHNKVLGTNLFKEAEDEHFTKHQSHKIVESSISETKNTVNETNELLCNVLREAVAWQNQFSSNKFTNVFNQNYKVDNINMQSSCAEIYKTKVNDKLPLKAENLFRYPVASYTKNDLSFSFLLKQNPLEPRLRKPKYLLRSDQHSVDEIQTCTNDGSLQQSFMLESYETSKINRIDETVLNFKPPFVSTPKRNKHSNVKTMSRISREITSICQTSRDHSTCSKTIDSKRKVISTTQTNKRLRNRSMSAKFLDILNGSCTTIIKGFKSIFANKKTSQNMDDQSKEVTRNVVEGNSCANSFTKYVHQRDAPVFKEKEDPDWTDITKEFSVVNSNSNFSSCNTCNDTFVLKYKFDNDSFLQQTVKRLKMGINLYGCDFKKISRTMWPREKYMTPNVLYNLYRKLIMKQ